MTDLQKDIVNIASSYIDKKEKPFNSGFYDAEFDKEMRDNGFTNGDAWCALFVKLVYKKAFALHDNNMLIAIDELFSKSAVKTFNSLSKSKLFEKTQTPIPGALVFWQTYKDGKPYWTGHCAIFTDFSNGKVITIDGNSNDAGSRNGDRVVKKARPINYFTENGLRLLGFINPKV